MTGPSPNFIDGYVHRTREALCDWLRKHGIDTEVKFVQLEAPPLPFPNGVEEWIP